MRKSAFSMLVLAAGLAISGLAAAPANALEPVKHGISSHANVVQARHLERHTLRRFDRDDHPGIRHRFRPRFYIAPVYSYRAFHDDCYWLKRKALRTGSRYWWHRYNECRWG